MFFGTLGCSAMRVNYAPHCCYERVCCGYNIVFDIFVHMHFFTLRDEYKLPSSVPRVQGCGVKCLHTGILRDEYKLQTSERHEVVDVTCVVA